MKRGLSIHDREQARRRAQAAERQQEQCKPVEDVACDCGCGKGKEEDMLYYVRDDMYVKRQGCADRVHGLNRSELNRWGRE